MEISYVSIQFLDLTITKGFSFHRLVYYSLVVILYTNTVSYLHILGSLYIHVARHILKGIYRAGGTGAAGTAIQFLAITLSVLGHGLTGF